MLKTNILGHAMGGDEIIGVVFVSILVGLLLLNARYQSSKAREWKALPTLDEYLSAHPGCSKGKGISCNTCGSTSIRNWGVFNADCDMRKFVCNHCGTDLYRKSKS